MSETNAVRVHLFHGTRLAATVSSATAQPAPYYTLADGTVFRVVAAMSVLQADATYGLDVQVEPVAAA